MNDFIFIYFVSLLMGSGTMAHDIKYKKISGIKLPIFFRICFFTIFIQNSKKETPIYKLLIQMYYQVGNLYLVMSRQTSDLYKQGILMIIYFYLVALTWIIDNIVLKYFYENKNESIFFELFHCQIIDNILIVVQAPANIFIVIDDIKEIKTEYLGEKFHLTIIKEEGELSIEVKGFQEHVMEEYMELKGILLEKNPLIKYI